MEVSTFSCSDQNYWWHLWLTYFFHLLANLLSPTWKIYPQSNCLPCEHTVQPIIISHLIDFYASTLCLPQYRAKPILSKLKSYCGLHSPSNTQGHSSLGPFPIMCMLTTSSFSSLSSNVILQRDLLEPLY